ncbi:Hsp20/alpha crystallin family protein [Marinigracilibium pacificum]|uniref:Hsp20/alpha crystallin family protein n=1 Tax=Marinigracilibium pacificum TaxID=2729599 RepID=A0A848J6F8_9BACT|nr:Hsp20/alpha crystallin family protein [Marinigracilibium pacificum]NMM49969.1 Hsp20/alpha crystallin family protein [Marinigracilibium pacificum]
MTLIRTKKDMFPALDNLFDDFFSHDRGWGVGDFMRTGTESLPKVNVKEDKESYTIELAAPGKKKEDFKIELEDNILTISSDAEHEDTVNEDNYTRREFKYSSFMRKFTLPESADGEKIKASYNHGVLDIHVPKREESKPKTPKSIDIL